MVTEILMIIGTIVVVLFILILFYGLIMQVIDVLRTRWRNWGEDA